MARKVTAHRDSSGQGTAALRPEGRNPRNRPAHDLDRAPPQPDAPEQSPVDEQQDQQPLYPEPLLNPPHGLREVQREIRNG